MHSRSLEVLNVWKITGGASLLVETTTSLKHAQGSLFGSFKIATVGVGFCKAFLTNLPHFLILHFYFIKTSFKLHGLFELIAGNPLNAVKR